MENNSQRDYWTLVLSDSEENAGMAVKPIDCNPGSDDEGLLVYRSYDAAVRASKHQLKSFGVTCHPVPLGKEQV
jgi:hypothetical protein